MYTMMYTVGNICCEMMYPVGSTQTKQIYNMMYMMYTVGSTQTKQMYIIMYTNVYYDVYSR